MLQRVIARFSVEIFCLAEPKNFAGEPFCAVFQKVSCSENIMDKKGEYHFFPSKNFCPTVPKKILGEPFSVSLISGIEKVYASDCYLTIFRRCFFCLAVPKNLAGETICAVFQKFSRSEKV